MSSSALRRHILKTFRSEMSSSYSCQAVLSASWGNTYQERNVCFQKLLVWYNHQGRFSAMEPVHGSAEPGWEYQGCARYRTRCITQRLLSSRTFQAFKTRRKIHSLFAYHKTVWHVLHSYNFHYELFPNHSGWYVEFSLVRAVMENFDNNGNDMDK